MWKANYGPSHSEGRPVLAAVSSLFAPQRAVLGYDFIVRLGSIGILRVPRWLDSKLDDASTRNSAAD